MRWVSIHDLSNRRRFFPVERVVQVVFVSKDDCRVFLTDGIEFAVDDGKKQRSTLIGAELVQFRSRADERACGAEVAVTCGVHEWSQTSFRMSSGCAGFT